MCFIRLLSVRILYYTTTFIAIPTSLLPPNINQDIRHFKTTRTPRSYYLVFTKVKFRTQREFYEEVLDYTYYTLYLLCFKKVY